MALREAKTAVGAHLLAPAAILSSALAVTVPAKLARSLCSRYSSERILDGADYSYTHALSASCSCHCPTALQSS